MGTQKTQNNQSNPDKDKHSWRNQLPWLQNILHRKSKQNKSNIVLAQNRTEINGTE